MYELILPFLFHTIALLVDVVKPKKVAADELDSYESLVRDAGY